MMSRDKAIQRLIDAAGAYCDIAKAHREYGQNRVRKMQEAAAMARNGRGQEAKNALAAIDSDIHVFDYADVHNALIQAMGPFERERAKK